jgi:hypothetical protein
MKMSDDILSVATPFPDVATLAQGYINRVDGERLLLPLEAACDEGAGVRFVIYLGDGTAAFAGAGRCVQVSDQGTNVPPSARFETLVDSLELDDRSRPVYDYIVAVRAAAYGQTEQAQDADEHVEDVADAEAVDDAEVEAEAAHVEADAALDVDVMSVRPEEAVSASEPAPSVEEFGFQPADERAFEEPAFEEPAFEEPALEEPAFEPEPLEALPESLSAADAEAVEAYASLAPPAAAPPSVRPASIPTSAIPESFRPEMASFIPPPLPTGILQRPPRALHWQPAPPRRPTPLPQTGLFRYAGPGLPKPAAAPRPELDPSLLVQRAPRPQ